MNRLDRILGIEPEQANWDNPDYKAYRVHLAGVGVGFLAVVGASIIGHYEPSITAEAVKFSGGLVKCAGLLGVIVKSTQMMPEES